jgi:recombination protein RecT
MQDTQITAAQPKDIRSLITSDKMKAQFAAALPQHLTPDRFCRIALTALTRTPKLAECTPESLMRCLLDLSAFGIEPDGRRAHLIPFENRKLGVVECTLILDWKGIAELAMRSGIIAKLHADIVCENDEFDYNLGEVVKHKIDFRRPRGEMYAVYAMAETKDGPVFVAVLNKEEVDGVRKRSKSGNLGPWVTDYNEMAKKTAFRRLAKWLPLSAEFRDAVDKDEDLPTIERDVTPKAARPVPLDPFAALPEPEETPAIEAAADPMDDAALLDLLDIINEAPDATTINKLIEAAKSGFDGAKLDIAKRAINSRAKSICLVWNTEGGQYE